MPSGFSRTVVNIGLEYFAVGVILFQKFILVVKPYLIYPGSVFNKRL